MRARVPRHVVPRPQAAFACVLLAVVGGCLGPAPPGGNGDRADTPAVAFGLPVVVDASRSAKEPSLAVAPDGAFYMCGSRGLGAGTDVWRSDAGTEWIYLGRVRPDFGPPLRSGAGDLGGGDCDISVDQGGRVYVADLWVGSASVSSSDDRGQTWTGVPASQIGPPMDRPWILGGAPDEVFVTGAELQTTGLENLGLRPPPAGGIWVARSTDGGRTFPQRVLAAPNDQRLGLNGNLALGAGDLYVVYTTKPAEGKLALTVARSADRGQTWTSTQAAVQDFVGGSCNPLLYFPTVAADDRGGVYAAWNLMNPATRRLDLFFAQSHDRGAHWDPPVSLADRAGTRMEPWIASDGAGRVGVAWYESNQTMTWTFSDSPRGQQRLECELRGDGPDSAWTLRYAWRDRPAEHFREVLAQAAPVHQGDFFASLGELFQLRFDPQGRAAIAYITDPPAGSSDCQFGSTRACPTFLLQQPGPGADSPSR